MYLKIIRQRYEELCNSTMKKTFKVYYRASAEEDWVGLLLTLQGPDLYITMEKDDPEDLHNILSMHTLYQGTDFRLNCPPSSTMSWDLHNVDEHPSREIK